MYSMLLTDVSNDSVFTVSAVFLSHSLNMKVHTNTNQHNLLVMHDAKRWSHKALNSLIGQIVFTKKFKWHLPDSFVLSSWDNLLVIVTPKSFLYCRSVACNFLRVWNTKGVFYITNWDFDISMCQGIARLPAYLLQVCWGQRCAAFYHSRQSGDICCPVD